MVKWIFCYSGPFEGVGNISQQAKLGKCMDPRDFDKGPNCNV